MLGGLGVRNPDVRPPITRSRSHTVPSNVSPTEPSSSAETPLRPTHGRSHSYVSPPPADLKPQNANTLPAEATPRLPIPSTGHREKSHSLRHPLRHRHTQSHVETYARPGRAADKDDDLPHLLAGLNAERLRRQGSTNANDLKRVTTGRSHRSGQLSLDANYYTHSSGDGTGRVDLVRKTVLDARNLAAVPRPKKTPIEILLERKDAQEKATRATLTAKDIERVQREQEDAEEELRERLVDMNKTNLEIMRRLDYTFYALLEKMGNLVSTIQSFQNLSTQSQHLMDNFTTETGKLDHDIQRRVKVFWKGYKEREAKAADLQERGRKAGVKAQDLNRRLENARIIVENWEKREDTRVRNMGRLWGIFWGTFITIFSLLLLTVLFNEWWFNGDPVRAGLEVPDGGSRNVSLVMGQKQLKRIDVPPEVREVLEGIERRRATKPRWSSLPETKVEEVREGREDERLRRLDEL